MLFNVLRSPKLTVDFQLLSVDMYFFSGKFHASFKYLDMFQILVCDCCRVRSCKL
jgi:hypothetical protein